MSPQSIGTVKFSRRGMVRLVYRHAREVGLGRLRAFRVAIHAKPCQIVVRVAP